MALNNSIELEVIPPSKEHGNTSESSSEAGDVTSIQNDGSKGQEENVLLQQRESNSDDDDQSGDSDWDLEFELNILRKIAFWDDDQSNEDQQPDVEQKLLETVEKKGYQKVHGRLTAKALMNYSRNPLLLAIKIAEKLHGRVKERKYDKYDFLNLVSRVEEFTMRFMDPLKYKDKERKRFLNNPETDLIVKTAIKLEQKKVFDHPVIRDLLNDRWYGGDRYSKSSKLWWLFLNVWCLFDMVLFPLTFLITFVIGKVTHSIREDMTSTGIHDEYKTYFSIPYFIFFRDMISYLVLLALHLAICVQPSQLSFSGLEWTILLFFSGRLLTEIKQILVLRRSEKGETKCVSFRELTKSYLRDRWNVFDLISIIIFICVIILRIVTLAVSGSVTNNRAVVIAGYLYGFNTMLLTVRAVGSILETFKEVGTIQTALFYIIRDAAVVVLHFVAITVAFASAITKIFVAEKSMVKEDITGKPPACNKTGIQCWWKITTHLAWSLLELSDGLSDLQSADYYSETLAQLLFAIYLILGLILLVNMLIALLSNTYQRVQENSRKEWVFQKAITVETYRTYHPIPVPFNIISIFVVWIYRLCKKKAKETDETDRPQKPQLDPKYLLDRYRLKYGDLFPPTDKLDRVFEDADATESMVNQVLYRTFTHQQGCEKDLPTGPEAWETHKAILVDDYLITRQPFERKLYRCGARYKTAFSRRFPHFEVMILETGATRWLGLGVVFNYFGTDLMPGWEYGTVGYHTDDRKIFDSEHCSNGKETIGANAARRGDVIRCTVLFENEKESGDGKFRVPVVFSVNGSRIVPVDKNQPRIEYSEDTPLFPYIAFRYANRVLAKMCATEDTDYKGKEMKSNFADLNSKLECMQEKLDTVLAKLQEKETHK